ncbi:NAD-dependent epimerase/dehydratase family protein [Vibrio hepatarius]|uniref:NAD-dependent epimerase/dehydratase family protein n=1 Tax=Vibrio hepatarius TaxID=171383 RepID=UPI00142DE725|nr:NAD-dependent epimerase/dehydratase family protein [Vibrio hepatarius]NIY83293.1 NAD-dependent epimerase/dehydratase family protein [Vibrio hepatarius]
MLEEKIKKLKGPILVIGASGFVGVNLFRELFKYRQDVYGAYFSSKFSWRLEGIPQARLVHLDIKSKTNILKVLEETQVKTVFDCSSYGAYSFEQESESIHQTNYNALVKCLEVFENCGVSAFVRAGSSSEYGTNSNGPAESDEQTPNSHYAVSKVAANAAVTYFGKVRNFPVATLRLYSVYGPYEDSSRLIPNLCKKALLGELPSFTSPEVKRDFIHVDDVVSAFVCAGYQLQENESIRGEAFNIGSEQQTSLKELALLTKQLFAIDSEPDFGSYPGREWDLDRWVSNSQKAKKMLDWSASKTLKVGIKETAIWWDGFKERSPAEMTKKNGHRSRSITAIIACYKDEPAIPHMYKRLVETFTELNIDYEIIFVNDCSPDNSRETILSLSQKDSKVIGINHSRNFGSQAAFRSGMAVASKDACVLLDGDLQDPPELIKEFYVKWLEGNDVVYGIRTKREMPAGTEFFYKSFYKVFSYLSEINIPQNAGDFSLIDKKVVKWILSCGESDVFLRGLRAYVGFKQAGVEYIRPERMFGVSTNNWVRNIGWAKRGIFSFSKMPLHLLTAFGGITLLLSILFSFTTVAIRLIDPELVPKGLTSISLLIMLFGAATILGLGILGEYIGKILDEVKGRPEYIRASMIKDGKEINE